MRYLAEATLRVIEAQPPLSACGPYDLTAGGVTSWYCFARRPAWSVLDCRRFRERFGFPQRPWEDLLAETIAEVEGGA